MGAIYYSSTADGSEIGRWFGKSIRKGSTVVKEKQIYLGKVVDKEKLIFFTRKDGYYRFNLVDQTKEAIDDKDVPLFTPPLDHRLRDRNVIVTFGGSYFVHQLINCIEYNAVLDVISLKKPDTMYVLLQYYLLSDHADADAFAWYQNSFARFLYPQANMASQRLSDFYVTFGSTENRRSFFEKHIPYLISAADDECAIFIDSAGCQNASELSITGKSKHSSETNIESRVVFVTQRSTGLPVYYEVIPRDAVDAFSVCRILHLMQTYGFRVTRVFGDTGYRCPNNLEKVILCGSDLVMHLNPAYDTYRKAVQDHWTEMTVSTYDKENDIRYRNRVIRVIQVPAVIGTDAAGNEVTGFVYLCRDIHSKSAEEVFETCAQSGPFAVVTRYEYDKKDVISYCYLREGTEQFFDYARKCCQKMPVEEYTLFTIEGHMLMSFIATFLVVLIKNRMNLLDSPYIAVPHKLQDNLGPEDTKLIVEAQEGNECVVEQEPISSVSTASPASLFFSLNFVGADVFEHQKDGDNKIIPSVPYRDANDFFKAFGIACPEAVLIKNNGSFQMILSPRKKITCRKSKVFAVRPYASTEAIEKKKAERKKEGTGDDKQQSEDNNENLTGNKL